MTDATIHPLPTKETGGWRHDDLNLLRDDKDRPIWNMANAIELLTQHSEWQGVLGFNQFTQRRVLLAPVPGQFGGQYPRPIGDADYVAAVAWFNFNGFPRAKNDLVRDAMRKVCEDNSFDPLHDYLNGLQWEGVERLAGWLPGYCGADATEYTQEVGLRWAISAVARGLKPGCKVDTMLVLEGPQGARKSTALRVLAGEEWFSDSLPPMGSKDAASYLAGKWIVEVGELEAMRKDVDQIKAFLSRQVERFRPAYAREEVQEPRRCVFAGTTNKGDWNRDETGGRRFWPVVAGTIDIDTLRRDRDQLWAEAVHLFKAGEPWWLEGDVAMTAQEVVAERRADDPWRADIERTLMGRMEMTPREVLTILDVAKADQSVAQWKRIAGEITALGWVRAGRMTRGDHKGQTRFVPGEEQ